MTDSPNTAAAMPTWAYFVRLFGQSFAVVWGGFWLIALIQGLTGSAALRSWCAAAPGCQAGYVGIAVTGIVLSAAVLVVSRLTRHRTEPRPGWHAATPWLLLAVAIAGTVVSMPLLLP